MNTPTAVLTGLLMVEAPRWVVLTGLGLVAAAYAACGLLTLTGRTRAHTRAHGQRRYRQLTSLRPTAHPLRNRLTPARLDRSGSRQAAGERT